MILPELEQGGHGADVVVDTVFFDDSFYLLREADPHGNAPR